MAVTYYKNITGIPVYLGNAWYFDYSTLQVFSSFLGGVVAYYSLRLFSGIFDLHTFSGVFLQGFLSGILGIAVIILTLYILRSQEFFEVVSSFKNSIFKTRVPAPEPEKLP